MKHPFGYSSVYPQANRNRNCNKWRPIVLLLVWRSAHFPFVITSPTFGHDREPHYYQQWQRWYQEFAQPSKLSWGTINVHNPFSTTSSLSRLYRPTTFLLRLSPIHLQPLFDKHSSLSSIRLPEPLKLLTSILVGDNVTNNTFILWHVHTSYYDFHFLLYFTFISHHFSFTIT
jgi:hypothetical protein